MNRLSVASSKQRLEDEGVALKLKAMVVDDSLNTACSYSANTELYPDNQIPFVEKHMAYLVAHPKVNSQYYLANLRLMLKKRSS